MTVCILVSRVHYSLPAFTKVNSPNFGHLDFLPSSVNCERNTLVINNSFVKIT